MSHDIVISAPRDLADSPRPAILQRSDEDFLEAVLEGCRTESGRQALRTSLAKARNRRQVLKLFQPIQRQFHVALLEAWCDRPGAPRIDPARVDSAGLVIRRMRRTGNSTRYEGWMRAAGKLRGWTEVDRAGGDLLDPEHTLRLAHHATGVASVDRALLLQARSLPDSLLDEHITPMFMAPPDVCSAAAQTLFYGIVPTTSSEIAATPITFDAAFGDNLLPFGPTDPDFLNHLVEGLRGLFMEFPLAGESLHPGWFDAVEATGERIPVGMNPEHWKKLVEPIEVSPKVYKNQPTAAGRQLQRFITLLRQVAIEFDAFADPPHAEAQRVRRELDRIRLPLKLKANQSVPDTVSASTFLEQAKRILLERTLIAGVAMPASWPALPAAQARDLAVALSASMRKRFTDVKGQPGRYDEPGAQYVLRAFVREKPAGGCRAKVHWSAYSEPFVIAQWYEGSGAPPLQVTLPDIGDLKGIKPNVAFVVPPSLQGLLGGSPKELLEGKGKPGEGGLMWICSFSLPIITICAFIVLNLFLSLFDLIFRWLFFIKICIPFPKKAE
jgi:hypothetical protein